MSKTHGDTGSPEFWIYYGMKARCYNPNNKEYGRYGARGIRVCERWRSGEDGISGYGCFLRDMGRRPSPKHTLDRIDGKAELDADDIDAGPESVSYECGPADSAENPLSPRALPLTA